MSDPLRTDAAAYDQRVGAFRTRGEIDRTDPLVAVRGFRARIPTMAQLQSLLKDGKLMLPLRYFRGYFLDLYA
jgi:hypothetical protein